MWAFALKVLASTCPTWTFWLAFAFAAFGFALLSPLSLRWPLVVDVVVVISLSGEPEDVALPILRPDLFFFFLSLIHI